jgi:hypothetical protein
VLANFQAHRLAAALTRRLLCSDKQKPPDIAAADVGSYRDGIKPGDGRPGGKKHQRVAHEPAAALFSDEKRRSWGGQEMAETSPRQNIDRKDGALEREQRVKIAHSAAAQLYGKRSPTRRPPHDALPASICTSIVSSRSNRSASLGGLSQRSRLMRGNRNASPDL